MTTTITNLETYAADAAKAAEEYNETVRMWNDGLLAQGEMCQRILCIPNLTWKIAHTENCGVATMAEEYLANYQPKTA